MPAHSKRAAASKRRGRNQYNEFVSAETGTTKTQSSLLDCPVIAPVIQIAQLTQTEIPDMRTMMEEGLDARSTRALFLNINKQLQSLRDQLTEAEEVRQEALELQAYFGERLASLPPELSVDQTEILQVLEKVNEGREKKLSPYLIQKLLTSDPREINRLHSVNRKLQLKVTGWVVGPPGSVQKTNKNDGVIMLNHHFIASF